MNRRVLAEHGLFSTLSPLGHWRSGFWVLALLSGLALFPCVSLGADLIGWATVSDLGQSGTTGGGDGPTVTVGNYSALASYASQTTPYTILVSGTISGSTPIYVASDKTIVGMGSTARLEGFGLDLNGVSNVVIRNFTIVGSGIDGIALRYSDHVWIDHCDLSACDDGLLDITKASDYVTVSWVRFSNHDKTCLVCSGTSEPDDVGKLNCTFHHCRWEDTIQRNPRVGYGKVHVFNCYYHSNSSYCIGVHSGARVLAERNCFYRTHDVIFQNYSSDPASPFYGSCEDLGNIFDGCTGRKDDDGVSFDPGDFYMHDFVLDDATSVPSVTASTGVSATYGFAPVLPIPGDGAIGIDTASNLSWTIGDQALSYDVHFGTSSSPPLVVNTTDRTYTPASFAPDTIYYWRVDVVTSGGTVPGTLWRFRTSPDKAFFPTPADGETGVFADADLAWRSGAGALSHNVYFGADSPPPFLGNTSVPQLALDSLSYQTTYCWRVDEITSGGVVTGDEWSFSTANRVEAGPGRVESENAMLLDGYYSEAIAGASNGRVAAIDGVGGSVQFYHAGADGAYDLRVTYLDEDDGANPYALYVGGALIGEWTASENPSGGAFRSRLFPGLAIRLGDDIRIVGSRQGGELARIDYIETTMVPEPLAAKHWMYFE
ncbi:polysaccharide lyase family 1 protein [Candidatus Sumerlaeota bacterium]|nr:polysaccharide lyase family 1 protein [Candidatus Sumerlaeota bacterium]